MNLKTLMIGYNVTHQNPSCREWIAADLQNVSKMRHGKEFSNVQHVSKMRHGKKISNELTVMFREVYYSYQCFNDDIETEGSEPKVTYFL